MAYLTSLLQTDRFVVPLAATRKQDAIREVATVLKGSSEVPDFRRFLSALFRKESRFGSGVDKGVSLPHYRDDSIKSPVVVIGVSPVGISWDKDETVQILVLVGWPDKHENAYLRTVADIARVFHRPEARKLVLNAKDPKAAHEAVLESLQETADLEV